MKRFIIDGYNLLRSSSLSFPQHLDLEGQREHLNRLLLSYANRNGYHITVVFDGATPNTTHSQENKLLHIIFSQADKEADDIIRAMIRKEKRPRQLTVVTSDNAIQFTARSHGVTCLTSVDFARILSASGAPRNDDPEPPNPVKYDPNLDDDEIRYWKSLFDNGEEDE